MNPYVDGLPEGMGRLRGWWTSMDVPARIALVFVLICLPFQALREPAVLLVAFGVITVVIGAGIILHRPGVRVIDASQPELSRLVTQAAATAGRHEPARIWLTGGARVRGRYHMWRRELLIGRALLDVATEADLRALVAHELAIVHPGYTASRLAARIERQRQSSDTEPSVAATLHERADRAAVAITGAEGAARAMLVSALADDEYRRYLRDVRRPRHWWLFTAAISDLHDGWRRALERGIPVEAEDVVEDMAEEHVGLAHVLSELSALTMRLRQG